MLLLLLTAREESQCVSTSAPLESGLGRAVPIVRAAAVVSAHVKTGRPNDYKTGKSAGILSRR
jgi:hypothetical protein